MKTYLAITGYPRTGTSALVRLLNFDDRILVTDEFGIFHDFNTYGRRKKLLSWPRLKNSNIRAYQRLVEKNISPEVFLKHLKSGELTGKDIFKVLEINGGKDFEVLGDKAPTTY